ncbi:Anhydro-N-acetylmuramic acid kinase [Gammaproteobacteria bacterium MOLA455]|nr:Anhydro-N-acetylmuramic acid kinase [Gammaproteobacteria bacterium MOLA455]
MANPNIYIGLMSGTSIDCIDAAAMTFTGGELQLLGTHAEAIPERLKQQIVDLCQPGKDSVQLLCETDSQLGELFAEAALTLMRAESIEAEQVAAIGSHGQTVRHSPPKSGAIAFTQQIGDANIIAARTGCPVVADFRRKDMALGGHGAPLVPAFHKTLFSDAQVNRIIANIGGISNITALPSDRSCYGFDTGPGNLLLDAWCAKHSGNSFDDRGSWGATGQLCQKLLDQFMAHPFIGQAAPKSTGREMFNLSWLETQLIDYSLKAEDIQATLVSFTAQSLAAAINGLNEPVDEVYVCGGGIFNDQLMAQLKIALGPKALHSTEKLGLDPTWVEACAFGWLACQHINNQPGNLPSVTGASREAVLGARYLP